MVGFANMNSIRRILANKLTPISVAIPVIDSKRKHPIRIACFSETQQGTGAEDDKIVAEQGYAHGITSSLNHVKSRSSHCPIVPSKHKPVNII